MFFTKKSAYKDNLVSKNFHEKMICHVTHFISQLIFQALFYFTSDLWEPNPALRLEKNFLKTLDRENILQDFFERPTYTSGHKDFALELEQIATDLDGTTTISTVLRSLAKV